MDFSKTASVDTINNVIKKLEARNLSAVLAKDKSDALSKITDMIPDGSSLLEASSTTLKEIGFDDYLTVNPKKWDILKNRIQAESDEVKRADLRRQLTYADYTIGSIHALTKEGEVIFASASGSQVPGYVYTARHVIWVVGAQKIVNSVEDGIKRIREYVFPKEDARMKSIGAPGSNIAKIILFYKEMIPGRVTLVLVNEQLGF
jgi:hypothetical protein